MDTLDRLLSYTAWANRVWIDFVFDKAPDDEYLTRMISHIMLAEQVWFQRICGEETDSAVFATKTKAELDALHDRHQQRYREVIGNGLDRVIAYRRFTGEAYESSVGEILLHLFTHASHHRGQMATHASREKLGPPNSDFITYSRTQ